MMIYIKIMQNYIWTTRIMQSKVPQIWENFFFFLKTI
jgi:hypothetical protein